MSFRTRLAAFVVAVVVTVQALTAGRVYGVTRHELIGEGQRQLGIAAHAFARQLDDLSDRVAASVQVLSLDFALRSAIAQRDRDTVLSALSNHGRLVGATRMLLVGLDGRVEADTAGHAAEGTPFPYPDLVEHALQRPAAAVVAAHRQAQWMVVVPVFAPDLVGFIAAAVPVDDRLLARLQAQSALPKDVGLATRDVDYAGRALYAWRTRFWNAGLKHGLGDWAVLAQAMHGSTLVEPAPKLDIRTDFDAAYLLLGRVTGTWRPAFRLDAFRTQQSPAGDVALSEHGRACTAALNWRLTAQVRVTTELLYLHSVREQRALASQSPRQDELQLQTSARWFF